MKSWGTLEDGGVVFHAEGADGKACAILSLNADSDGNIRFALHDQNGKRLELSISDLGPALRLFGADEYAYAGMIAVEDWLKRQWNISGNGRLPGKGKL